jgi:hypothetical protein
MFASSDPDLLVRKFENFLEHRRREEKQTSPDLVLLFMRSIDELCNDSETGTSTPYCPEEIFILCMGRRNYRSVCKHELGFKEVVDSKTVSSCQPSITAS